jgi:hypothetical protein
MIKDTKTERVILFASVEHPSNNFSRSDGSESNLPLVVALAEFNIPGVAPIYVVFDGPFLTAARRPRYLEVRELLDTAIESGKAFFSQQRVPFTSTLSAEGAAQELLKVGPIVQLTSVNRAVYFQLLSPLTEASYP